MFLLQAAKERGRAGRGEGIHYYSYKLSFSLCGLKVSTFSNDCKFSAIVSGKQSSIFIVVAQFVILKVNQCNAVRVSFGI